MPVKIKSYGGIPGWVIHKYLSRQLIGPWLFLLQTLRRKSTERFVNSYIKMYTAPLFHMVEIETINRCNGKCAFCPSNVNSEKRPFKKMPEEVFKKIVSELKKLGYSGEVLLEVNNEPLIDVRLKKFASMLKTEVPSCKVGIITNGTLLTVDKLEDLKTVLDKIIINNYSKKYRLNGNISEIYNFIKKHEQQYKDIEIEIRRRYISEILTNRAGMAPNNKKASYNVTMPCLYPFVGITIFPDGVVGLCSNDCFEQTDFGNINEERMVDIWNGSKMKKARIAIAKGRKNYNFCKSCDVIGIGTREKIAQKGWARNMG